MRTLLLLIAAAVGASALEVTEFWAAVYAPAGAPPALILRTKATGLTAESRSYDLTFDVRMAGGMLYSAGCRMTHTLNGAVAVEWSYCAVTLPAGTVLAELQSVTPRVTVTTSLPEAKIARLQ